MTRKETAIGIFAINIASQIIRVTTFVCGPTFQRIFSLSDTNLGIILGFLLLAEIIVVVFFRDQVFPQLPEVESFGAPRDIGLALFNDYLLPFEITAFLLLAAMVGAIVIARRVRQKPQDKKE